MVQRKNLEKIPSKYNVTRTFGVGLDDYTNLSDENKIGKHIGCALALVTKNSLKTISKSRVNHKMKNMVLIKPLTPAGKVKY